MEPKLIVAAATRFEIMLGIGYREGISLSVGAAIASFLTGVLLYAAIWLVTGWRCPFGAAGVRVAAASLVMVVVSLLTKPMDPELRERIFNPEHRDAREGVEVTAGRGRR